MSKKAVAKYSFLVGSAILIAAILLLTVGPVMSGTYHCIILPTVKEDRDWYCPTCGLAFAFCDIKPTPGYSGCQCAEDFCAKWIDNDVCDWNFGIHVCRSACKDIIDMPICSQVSAHGAVSSKGTPIQPFPFTCCGYVPTGGCCDENVDCATGKCSGFNAACPGYKSCACAIESEACMSDKDCCQTQVPALTCNLNQNPNDYETKKICSYCSGKIYMGLSKYSAYAYEAVTAYISGLDNVKCNGRSISIKLGSCNGGTELTKCNYNNKYLGKTECMVKIGSSGTDKSVVPYNVYACADTNGDGYYSNTESSMQLLTITSRSRGPGGSGRNYMLGTSEGLNNPIVILVALIAVVIIIYGAFKFFAMPKKRR